MLPLISCVCPTFGKTKHLEEAVESFHRQTYSNKELVIFNNYPRMDIVYDHPDVTVVNYREDIYSIGACRNEGNKYAKGEYICTWDDDDISLPNRLKGQLEGLLYYANRGGTKFAGASITNAWYSEGNVILKKIEKFMSSSLISTTYWEDNQYPMVDDDDQWMYYKMLHEGKMVYINSQEPQYIYRWGTGTYHVSGLTLSPKDQRTNMMMWADIAGLPDTLTLHPYWERDYEQDVKDFILSNK